MSSQKVTLLQIPTQDPISSQGGKLTQVWAGFFRKLRDLVEPLGAEKSFQIENNKSSADDIDGLSFNRENTSQARIDYLIQRVTTSTGATELIETGAFYLAYKPTSETWVLSGGPSSAGVTLSVTSSGKVRYTSTNITGTASISKITWRASVLAAKHSTYSIAGR